MQLLAPLAFHILKMTAELVTLVTASVNIKFIWLFCAVPGVGRGAAATHSCAVGVSLSQVWDGAFILLAFQQLFIGSKLFLLMI